MQYKEIPYVTHKVSRMLYGTQPLPFANLADPNRLLDTVFNDLGINTFDLARVYPGAEALFGRWLLHRQQRDDVVILSKCGHPAPDGTKRVNEAEMRRDYAESAEDLHTDYIDIYLLHRDDLNVPAGDIVEIFNAMHAEGKIGAFGGSNWTAPRIAEANEYAYKHSLIPFTVTSPGFGLARQIADPWGGGCTDISGPAHADERAWYKAQNMPVIAYAGLCHGFLSGKLKSDHIEQADEVLDRFARKGYLYPENVERLRRCEEMAKKKGASVAQIAMAWIYHQDLNTFAVVSSCNETRMRQNTASLDIALTEEEISYLNNDTK